MQKTVTPMKICVFCSANSDIDREYFRLTEEFGRWVAENGHSMVFGGTSLGLMACVAEAAHKSGAMTIGVVPTKVEERDCASRCMDVHIPCDNLNDRKELMMAQGDAFVALPGGIGTLDEIFTVAASATIGYHHKPLIVYDMDGFWDGLVELLDGIKAKGMIRGDWRSVINVCRTLDEVKACLSTHEG